MENVIIAEKGNFEDVKEKLRVGGSSSLHVIADFDRTLTGAFLDNGDKIPSVISVLRNYKLLSEEYSVKATELFNTYHPFEVDPSISDSDRTAKMEEWWNAHFAVLMSSGLKREHIEKVVAANLIKLRPGVVEFLKTLNQHGIPLLIFSSNGIGNTIEMILEKEGVLFDNIHVLTNVFDFDADGNATKLRGPAIHVANKDETILSKFPQISEAVSNRKNVVLLGDGLDDLRMSRGFDSDILLTFGFLNYKVDKMLDTYKEKFDVVLTGNASFDFINKFFSAIV